MICECCWAGRPPQNKPRPPVTRYNADFTVFVLQRARDNKQGGTRQRRPSEPAVYETKLTHASLGLNREIKPLTSPNFWAAILQLYVSGALSSASASCASSTVHARMFRRKFTAAPGDRFDWRPAQFWVFWGGNAMIRSSCLPFSHCWRWNVCTAQ